MTKISEVRHDMIANYLVPDQAVHPGEVLREELEFRNLTQTRLAARIGVSVSLLNELINCKRDFTTEYALLLEAALGIDADFWLNMQSAYNKNRVKNDSAFMSRLERIRKIAAVL